jgi:hypothetical protein
VKGSNLFAGTDGGGVFLSTNNGTSWTAGQTASSGAVKALVKADNFPEIELIVNVSEAKSGKGIYGLNQADFSITEDGAVQAATSFVAKAEGKVDPIDIVFLFDETGSMQDEINAVRDNALNFVNVLKGSNMDYRLALITFSDKIEKTFDFTSDVNQFKSQIASIAAFGGDDEPENALAALDAGLKLKFRPNAQVVFILITDAPYHQRDAVTALSMLPLAKKMKLEGIKIYPIAVKLEQYIWMARETEGTYFDILSNFSGMIEQLAAGLTAQYRLKYVSAKPAFDNTWRKVEIAVKKFGQAAVSYKSAANVIVSSQLIERNRPSDAYKAENLIDGNNATAWAEGADGAGIGEWIKFGFDTPRKIKAIKILAGYAKTEAVYLNNNRAKKLKVIFSDGEPQIAELKDVNDFQRILIDRDRPTKFVKLEILEVFKGRKFDDTCLSEIDFEFKD